MRPRGTAQVRLGVPAVFPLLAIGVATGMLVASSPLFGAAVLGVTTAMLLIFLGGWKMQVALLVVATTLTRFAFRVTDVDLRLDQVLPVALLLGHLGAVSLGRAAWPRIPGTTPLLLFLGLGVCSAFIAGRDVWPAARFGAMLATGVALWFVVARRLADPPRRAWATRLLVGVAAVHGLLAIILVGLHFLIGSNLGLQPGGPVPFLVYGTFYEANIMGSFLAAALVLALGAPALDTVRLVWRWLAIMSIVAGLALTFTRAAWIATCVGILVLVAGKLSHTRRVLRLLAYLGITIAVVALAFPSLAMLLSGRVNQTFDFSTGSGYGRLRVVSVALEQWKQEPWLGTGFGTFRDPTLGAGADTHGWIPNLTVWSLHDTGIAGTLLLALFLILLFRNWSLPEARPYLAAVTTLVVAFQATPGIVLGYFWLFCGMVSAFAPPAGPARWETKPRAQPARAQVAAP